MPKIEPFENFTDEYDAWFSKNQDLYDAELKAVRMLLPAVGKGLEVGVGSGKFASPLKIGTGVEPSQQMANRSRALGINVICGAAEHLPFSDSEFDYILMVTTICFLDDISAAFSESLRVLKPGGCIIVGFVDSQSELGRTYEANRESSEFYRYATFFCSQDVTGHLERAGFAVDSVIQALVPGRLPSDVLPGSGKGAFVVIRGLKSDLCI
ncbi:MAG: class I SAM-dependent methyltransferase [Candidatus Wallbacteria bacterium]|nr:class I SAM-dependent methyltransferase [Candidatus Wallbacteria bacterium]